VCKNNQIISFRAVFHFFFSQKEEIWLEIHELFLVFVVHSCAVSLPFGAPSAEDDKGAATQNHLRDANDHPPRAAIAKGQTNQPENAPQSMTAFSFGGSKR
jgi:hypothetical protein